MTSRHGRRAAGLLAGACASVLLLSGVPAGAVTTNQSYWVPITGKLTVRGHGFGHGHGMSQYGAQGAALQGLTARQILGFYYPGTTLATATGTIRVLITSDTSRDVVVGTTPGLTVRDRGNGKSYLLPSIGATKWRLNVDADGNSVVGYHTSAWHRWHPGGASTLAGDGEFSASSPLTLYTPYGSAVYRGALRAASPSPGSHDRDTVNVLSLDRYVQGVVPAEMPPSWEPAAVRAQAIAARTYAAFNRAAYLHRYYQICDTSSCQVYRGVDGEDSRANDAVVATAHQVLSYQGKPAFTQFSASDGGWTSAGSVPYLDAHQDPYDAFSGNPVHDWTATISTKVLLTHYPSLGSLNRVRVIERDGNGDWRGRVWDVVLDGTKSDITISGDTFRSIYGLRSSWFTIDPTPIQVQYKALGGATGVLGSVTSAEYVVPSGAAQNFGNGRIYYSATTGAHEVYGPILTGYLAVDGPASDLALPMSGVVAKAGGQKSRFQGGMIYTNSATGTFPVLGAIATAYRGYGGPSSDLGWPTSTNITTSTGQKVTFEHGTITWNKTTNKTTINVTG